jgi:cyclic-di-GMP phosphodiesterase TipF (flagellum assembly factor)
MRRQDESKPSAAPATVGPPAAEAAPKTDSEAEPKRERQSRDGFVPLCIAVVSVAIGTMLFGQFGLPLATSIGAGVGAWIVFMLIHKHVQKSAQIAELQAELARARFQNTKPRPAALRGMKLPPVTGAGPSAPDLRQPEFGPTMKPAESAQSATAARAASVGAAAPAVGPQGPAANSDINFAPTLGRSALPPLRGGPAPTDKSVKDAAASPDAAPSVDLTGMRLPAAGSASGNGADMAARDDRPAQGAEMIRDQWSFRPRTEKPVPGASIAGARPATTVEGDLELVQRKIRELADEVNFAEASRPAKQTRADIRSNPTTDAIEHSIGALKAAATTMRERPGGLGDFIPKSAKTEPAPEPAPPREPASLPGLGELVIPATAERIAGADNVPEEAPVQLPSGRREPSLSDHPLFDFGMNNAPPAAMPPHGEEIARAIDNAAIDVFLAPLVTLSEHAVNHYEMTATLRSAEGARLDLQESDFSLIGRDLAAKFDIERLRRAAALSVRMEARDKDGSLLMAIMGGSLSNRAFLETIAQVYGARQKFASQLVVTLTQRAIDDFEPSVWQAIRDMHAYGFRFALDGLEHMRTDFAALAVAGFRFIRLPAHVLFDGFSTPERFVPADEIYQRATLAGLSVVATGVEDAKTQKRLLEIGIDLGQGTLFGVPRQVMLNGPTTQSAAA